MRNSAAWTALSGRVLIALMFVLSGLEKLGNYEGMQGYMASVGVPGSLLWLAIVLEVAGGMMIVAGLYTRIVAVLLGGFCVLTAILFHGNLADQMTFIMFMKNISIAGGFLVLAAHGAGVLSLDQLRARNRVAVGSAA